MEYSYNGGMNNMAASPEVKPSENFFMGLIGALGGAVLSDRPAHEAGADQCHRRGCLRHGTDL